jgi:hypothetical protein
MDNVLIDIMAEIRVGMKTNLRLLRICQRAFKCVFNVKTRECENNMAKKVYKIVKIEN